MKQYSKDVVEAAKFIIWNNRIEKTEDFQNVVSNINKQFSKDVLELILLIRDNGEAWFETKYNINIEE